MEFMVDWTCSLGGENKKFIQNYNGKTCWKAATWIEVVGRIKLGCKLTSQGRA
jgi:hypothetical protein